MSKECGYRRHIKHIVAGALIVSVVTSAVATIVVKHEIRMEFSQLEKLKDQIDEQEFIWKRLQLERSAFRRHNRIATLAYQELKMHRPRKTISILLKDEN